MSIRRLALPVLVLAIASLAALALFLRSGPAPTTQADPTAASAERSPAPAQTANVPNARQLLPPKPPRGQPLRDSAAALVAHADAGDGKAACRLAIEILNCRSTADLHARMERSIVQDLARLRSARDSTGPTPRTRQIPMIDRLETQLANVRAEQFACASLPPGLIDRGTHYLRRAALAGESEAMLRYGIGDSFERDRGFTYLQSPEFDRWRGEAMDITRQALAAGRPEAALILFSAYQNDHGLLAGLVEDDLLQAAAYWDLVQRLFGESIAKLPITLRPPALPPADQARARDLAAQWQATYFGDRKFDVEQMMAALEPPRPGASAAGNPGPEPCATPGPSRDD